MFKKLIICSSFFLATIFFYSCEKTWNQPTDVSFSFKLNDNSNTGLVTFTDGFVVLDKFYFQGERKQGDNNIEFKQDFNLLPLAFNTTNDHSQSITFQIPQGTYTKINIALDLDTAAHVASMQINGFYVRNIEDDNDTQKDDDERRDTIPVTFKLMVADVFNMIAENSSGMTEINLVEGKPAEAIVTLNPQYWFANISHGDLEHAINKIDHKHFILIDKNTPNGLYNLIVSRMKNGNQVVFN